MITDELFIKQMTTARQSMASKVYLSYPIEVKNLLLKLYAYSDFMTADDMQFVTSSMTLVEKALKK